ncbi:unnamed protein product [Brugia pahangi]|uniref:Cas1_AcylT domain-containing protein n=1 Tax=Brugia pahangi TaxID=6280 RepID=A0A0N4SXP4_BRUPA|nr:unnamed protein product [Brugia pahangi]
MVCGAFAENEISCRYYGHHYTWHGNETFPLHIQMSGFLCLLTFYVIYGLKKVEVITDRSTKMLALAVLALDYLFIAGWKGGNREFLWCTIEDRFSHKYAFAWEPFKESEPPKLLLMRRLQNEMWSEALKHGTWFLDPHDD